MLRAAHSRSVRPGVCDEGVGCGLDGAVEEVKPFVPSSILVTSSKARSP